MIKYNTLIASVLLLSALGAAQSVTAEPDTFTSDIISGENITKNITVGWSGETSTVIEFETAMFDSDGDEIHTGFNSSIEDKQIILNDGEEKNVTEVLDTYAGLKPGTYEVEIEAYTEIQEEDDSGSSGTGGSSSSSTIDIDSSSSDSSSKDDGETIEERYNNTKKQLNETKKELKDLKNKSQSDKDKIESLNKTIQELTEQKNNLTKQLEEKNKDKPKTVAGTISNSINQVVQTVAKSFIDALIFWN